MNHSNEPAGREAAASRRTTLIKKILECASDIYTEPELHRYKTSALEIICDVVNTDN